MKANTLKSPFLLAVVSVMALFGTFFVINNQLAGANVTTDYNLQTGKFLTYTFFSTSTVQTILATTTTATSTNIDTWVDSNGQIDKGYFVIAGAKQVSLYFGRGERIGGGNTGGTQYRIQVTPKENPTESDWYYFNKLTQNLATSTYPTTLAIASTSATSTLIMGMDLSSNTYYAIRCLVQEATDGSHECRASAAW